MSIDVELASHLVNSVPRRMGNVVQRQVTQIGYDRSFLARRKADRTCNQKPGEMEERARNASAVEVVSQSRGTPLIRQGLPDFSLHIDRRSKKVGDRFRPPVIDVARVSPRDKNQIWHGLA
jgi:hypothetical protein